MFTAHPNSNFIVASSKLKKLEKLEKLDLAVPYEATSIKKLILRTESWWSPLLVKRLLNMKKKLKL